MPERVGSVNGRRRSMRDHFVYYTRFTIGPSYTGPLLGEPFTEQPLLFACYERLHVLYLRNHASMGRLANNFSTSNGSNNNSYSGNWCHLHHHHADFGFWK